MAAPAITFTSGEASSYYAARVPHLKQRRAAEWRGACPVHHGKNDSFAVDPATGRWFCHSTCGRGGDILELEEALSGGDFPMAGIRALVLVFFALDCAIETTRPMSCDAISGLGAWMRVVPGERMKQIINSDGVGPARA
jgi:hypothetical protein